MGHVVRGKIDKEVCEGRILGLFERPRVPYLRVSYLGVVLKKAQGEFRLIHHLSFPEGDLVNDAIPLEMCSVHYTSFETTVCMVQVCGFGTKMVKCNIKSTFYLLPVHLGGCDLGFLFQGAYYIDRALPMSCSIFCAAFEHFSSFLEWNFRCRAGKWTVVGHLPPAKAPQPH